MNVSRIIGGGAAGLALLLAIAGCATPATRPTPAQIAPAQSAPKASPSATQAEVPRSEGEKFKAFLRDFRVTVLGDEIKAETYDRATAGLMPNARIKMLNEQQPEFVQPIWQYVTSSASAARAAKGRDMLAANVSLFDRLESQYGVPREILTAIWGMESNYGQNEGSYNLFEALATLAYDGPRQDYGRRQFLAALKLSERERLDPKLMVGSWAGAVGHTQFVPTTYLSNAVDGDGDGKRDLWNSAADALASAANYLKSSGWQADQSWGLEVQLPPQFAYELADQETSRTMDEWAALGLRNASGAALMPGASRAVLFLPAGYRGPAFLYTENFAAILKYNNAAAYGLSVGILANRLQGKDGVIGTWPRDEQPLDTRSRVALQQGLENLGFATGGVDGLIGERTRAALRLYQKARGLPADGFATQTVLTQINAEIANKTAPP